MTLLILFIILVTDRWILGLENRIGTHFTFRTMMFFIFYLFFCLYFPDKIVCMELYYLMKCMEFDRYLAFGTHEYQLSTMYCICFIFIKYHGYNGGHEARVSSYSIIIIFVCIDFLLQSDHHLYYCGTWYWRPNNTKHWINNNKNRKTTTQIVLFGFSLIFIFFLSNPLLN